MPSLFDPLPIGDLTLPNRVVMAPLSRLRAGTSNIPTSLMAEYYAQRASAGLIISEGVQISPQGVGYKAGRASGQRTRSRAGSRSPGR